MTAPPRAAGGSRRQSVALAVISAAQLMFLLDATIVNVALPAIQRAVGLTGSDLEWVVASYSVAFGGLLMLGGRAGDLLGRRRVFAGGVALFTLASLVGGCAGAGESWLLIVCRTAQGVGAAAASPAALSLIAVTFEEGPRRDRAVGWYTAAVTAGGGVGLLAGGLITTYLSWRWVMFVNVPVGVLVLAAGRRVLPETPRRTGHFDVAGALTGTLAALLLVYGLVAGAEHGAGADPWAQWRSPWVAGSLAGAAVLTPVFVLLERRAAQPLVPLRLFADRTRFGTYTVTALESTAMFGIFFFLTLFLQRFWDYSALHTALVYLPLTCLLVAGAKLSSALVARLGARRLICGGLLVAAAGMVWLSRIGESGGWATGMLPPTVLVYAGLGVTGVPLTLAALARVADGDSGAASGLFTMSRQIGGAVGLAVLGAVVWPSAAGAAEAGEDAAGAGADAALAAGISDGFLVAAGLTVLAALVALLTVPRGAGAAGTPPGPTGSPDATRGARTPEPPPAPTVPEQPGAAGVSGPAESAETAGTAATSGTVGPAGPQNTWNTQDTKHTQETQETQETPDTPGPRRTAGAAGEEPGR